MRYEEIRILIRFHSNFILRWLVLKQYALGRSTLFPSFCHSTSEVGAIITEENPFWLFVWLENLEEPWWISWTPFTWSSGTDGSGWPQWCQCRISPGVTSHSSWWPTALLPTTQIKGKLRTWTQTTQTKIIFLKGKNYEAGSFESLLGHI